MTKLRRQMSKSVFRIKLKDEAIMSEPEWLRLLNEAFVGEANGAIKSELRAKWGKGNAGPQLMETLKIKIEAVIAGLREFGEISAESFRGALIAEIRRAVPGSTHLVQ